MAKKEKSALATMNIEDTTRLDFVQYVSKKHGKVRGVLHEEATQAIKEYMANHPLPGGGRSA